MFLISFYRNIFKDSFLYWIIILNLIIYIPVILIIPGFILDDYYLFYIISQNPGAPISTDQSEAFFLFMRPLSYISFWFDYIVFNANPILVKFFSLFLHLVLVVSIYLLLKKFTFLILKKNDNLLIFLAALIFSFHLDCAIWIYWISNKTELLALLFYVLSISAFIKYNDTRRTTYILLCALFFLLSITSKQTGLHLPVLLMFIVYLLNWKFDNDNRRKIITFIAFGLVVMILFSTVNYYVYKSDLNISQIFWKKPFSFIGNFLHVIVPYHSQNIYNFFLVNKTLAIILLGFFVIALLSVLIFLKKEKSKVVLFGLLFVLIIMYPRILAVAEHRINGILVFWFVLILALCMHKLKKEVYLIIMPVILFYFLITLIIRIGELENKIESYDNYIMKYTNIIKSSAKKDLVVIAENNFSLNYQAYYHLHKSFGCMDGVINSPVFYDVSLVYFDIEHFYKPFISVYRSENSFRVESLNDLIFLSIDRRRVKDYYLFTKIIPQYKSREYKQINFTLDNSFPVDEYNLIYFNGIDWVTID